MNQLTGRTFCISAIRCLSSLIASLEISPLYRNNGNPSSTSELRKGVCPSRNSNIAIGYLSLSTIKNRFSFTTTSSGANSCLSILKNEPSFLVNEFNSRIRSASVAYMTFCRCLSVYVNDRLCCFGLSSIVLGAVLRPSQKPIPKIININIKSPMISPNHYMGAL